MSWTRLDDNWLADEAFDGLDIPTMWHYLHMIQFCSRGKRYSGVMPLAHARTCSTVADQMGALQLLSKLASSRTWTGRRCGWFASRSTSRRRACGTRQQQRRSVSPGTGDTRTGDHRECLPEKCPHASNGGSNALPQDRDRTGPDRTGRGEKEVPTSADPSEDEMWEEYQRTYPETLAND